MSPKENEHKRKVCDVSAQRGAGCGEDVWMVCERSVPPEPYKYKCLDKGEPQIMYVTNNVYTVLQGVGVEMHKNTRPI